MNNAKDMASFERHEVELIVSALKALLKEFVEWYRESQATESSESLGVDISRAVFDSYTMRPGEEPDPMEREAYIEHAAQGGFDKVIRRDGKYQRRSLEIRNVLAHFEKANKVAHVEKSVRRFARGFLRGALLRSASKLSGIPSGDPKIKDAFEQLSLFGRAETVLWEHDITHSPEESFPFNF